MSSPLSLSSSPQLPQQAAADPVKDVDLATFMVDVIEASRQQPVVVNFWSARSTLCKQLTPVLEKLIRGYKGALRLARVDIDHNLEIAQQMGVQSVPAVFAFFQGRPVDGFAGAQSEAQIKTWLERLVKATGGQAPEAADDLDAALKQAMDFLAANDIAAAKSIYADILDMDPFNAAAYGGMVRCLIAAGEVERAKQMLADAPEDIAKNKLLDTARTAIELADQAKNGGSAAELQAKLEKNPADHQTRFDLAMAHYAAGKKEDAVDQLLEIVRRQRNWNEDAARKQLVKFFEVFGLTDPLTISARKRLSSILFS